MIFFIDVRERTRDTYVKVLFDLLIGKFEAVIILIKQRRSIVEWARFEDFICVVSFSKKNA